MFWLLRIGAGDHDAAVAQVSERGPHLLAVDDPLVAIAYGPHLQTGDVGTCARLGEHLAPHLVSRDERSLVGESLFVGAVLVKHRQAHALADRQPLRHQRVVRGLIAPDRRVRLGESLPAVLDGIGEPGQPGVGKRPLKPAGASQGLLTPRIFEIVDLEATGVRIEERSAAQPELVECLGRGGGGGAHRSV